MFAIFASAGVNARGDVRFVVASPKFELELIVEAVAFTVIRTRPLSSKEHKTSRQFATKHPKHTK